MKREIEIGAQKTHSFIVQPEDAAKFEAGIVHPVCATFTLAREIEWATRLFVLDVLDSTEEGIGTSLTIQHLGPALIGKEVTIEAEIISFDRNELICNYIARCGSQVVAKGATGQKILKKSKLKSIFEQQ